MDNLDRFIDDVQNHPKVNDKWNHSFQACSFLRSSVKIEG